MTTKGWFGFFRTLYFLATAWVLLSDAPMITQVLVATGAMNLIANGSEV